MNLSALGEFGLIERIKKSIKTDATVIKGIGDDCAVIKFDKNNYMLLTCDMVVEGIDFKHGENPFLIGRKALAVSASDIAACAGLPRYALISIGMPKSTQVEYIDEILKGLRSVARKYAINIVGGDISRSDKLCIDVSMVGMVEKKNLILRSGARAGDVIFVSGPLGGSLYGRHLRFTPRVKEARYLATHCKVNAMIDISDGLLQDLGHILEESNAGAIIYEELIPISKEAKGFFEALTMGEDFELLFTSPRKNNIPSGFYPIGYITKKESGLKLITKEEKVKKIKALGKTQGFTHF